MSSPYLLRGIDYSCGSDVKLVQELDSLNAYLLWPYENSLISMRHSGTRAFGHWTFGHVIRATVEFG